MMDIKVRIYGLPTRRNDRFRPSELGEMLQKRLGGVVIALRGRDRESEVSAHDRPFLMRMKQKPTVRLMEFNESIPVADQWLVLEVRNLTFREPEGIPPEVAAQIVGKRLAGMAGASRSTEGQLSNRHINDRKLPVPIVELVSELPPLESSEIPILL